jgi:large subunit ribosomal protein L21
MYAIIRTGGKQHRVQEGESLRIDLLRGKKNGEQVVFDDVLMLASGDDYKVGAPKVSGATVNATILRNGEEGDGEKAKKVIVYKKKRRKGYERTQGHRARYTEVRIDKISG